MQKWEIKGASFALMKNDRLIYSKGYGFADEEEKTSQLRELYRMINMLGKLERALILLWLEERSHQEIADILGISKNYVAVKLYRIKENLKNMSNS